MPKKRKHSANLAAGPTPAMIRKRQAGSRRLQSSDDKSDSSADEDMDDEETQQVGQRGSSSRGAGRSSAEQPTEQLFDVGDDEVREARRPEAEARAAECAQKRARRQADVRVAQWWYDMCRQDEEAAREGNARAGGGVCRGKHNKAAVSVK